MDSRWTVFRATATNIRQNYTEFQPLFGLKNWHHMLITYSRADLFFMSDLSDARVLVIDDAPTVRQSVRLTLNQAGIPKVDTANSVGDARRRIRNGCYDIILSDYHFGEGMSGQDLLEELRHTGEMPLSTIWFMITAEAAYERVVAVAEVGPDDYLLKPFTSATLADRLQIAWQRKLFLKPVLDRANAGKLEKAIAKGIELLERAGSYRMDLVRLLSNLLLEAGRHDEARAMFEEILGQRVVPWAKLGLAKSLAKQGNKTQAEGVLQSAIHEHQQYVDAYEELAALYMADGRTQDAMGVLDKCLSISPNNVSRLQKAGHLANMMGDATKARQLLERAVYCGGNSCKLSPGTLLQLALATRREGALGDSSKYLRMAQEVAKRNDGVMNWSIGKMASAIYQNKIEPLAEVEPFLVHPEFTQEAAVGFIMTADLICPPSQNHEQGSSNTPPYSWLHSIARRFITTKHHSALLETAAGTREGWKRYIRDQGMDVAEINKFGVQMMLKDQIKEAANLLVMHAESSLNHRLMLSASHATIKYLKTGAVSDNERNSLAEKANLFVDRLSGLIDEGVRQGLLNDITVAVSALHQSV